LISFSFFPAITSSFIFGYTIGDVVNGWMNPSKLVFIYEVSKFGNVVDSHFRKWFIIANNRRLVKNTIGAIEIVPKSITIGTVSGTDTQMGHVISLTVKQL
jgi:hypothetical protein